MTGSFGVLPEKIFFPIFFVDGSLVPPSLVPKDVSLDPATLRGALRGANRGATPKIEKMIF